ncbi:MAG: hypothetical protein ACLP9L_37080 [Thermoguttaceae bacterium]
MATDPQRGKPNRLRAGKGPESSFVAAATNLTAYAEQKNESGPNLKWLLPLRPCRTELQSLQYQEHNTFTRPIPTLTIWATQAQTKPLDLVQAG